MANKDLIFSSRHYLDWNSEDISALIENEYMDNDVNQDDDLIAKKNLLNASAKGTEEKYYLNPNPFYNKLGIDYLSARLDEIKMNVLNMDYTNADNENEVGVNLLMPQYQRRVEVEDLNKNFWVIGQVLSSVVQAIWEKDGIIDIIEEIIKHLNNIWEDMHKYIENIYDALNQSETIIRLGRNNNSLDINGDGFLGNDDAAFLLSFYAHVATNVDKGIFELFEEFIIKNLKFGNSTWEEDGEYCINLNDGIVSRKKENLLVIKYGLMSYYLYENTNEGSIPWAFYSGEIYENEITFERFIYILYKRIQSFGRYVLGINGVEEALNNCDAKASSALLALIANGIHPEYTNDEGEVVLAEKQANNLNNVKLLNYASYGFRYDKIVSSNSDLLKLNKGPLEGEEQFFYYNSDSDKVLATDNKWDTCVYTQCYCYSAELDKKYVTMKLIPHIAAYEPASDDNGLITVFENKEAFLNWYPILQSQINRVGGNYVLLLNETLDKTQLCGYNREAIETNTVDTIGEPQEFGLFDKDAVSATTGIEVYYWGAIEKNNYFEIARILSRRIYYELDSGEAKIQNYCLSNDEDTSEIYYLKYDMRKIIPYFWDEVYQKPIQSVINYFGPFRTNDIARFRGKYYTAIHPATITEDMRSYEDGKIYLNRVHTPRHTDGKWNQMLKFYHVSVYQNNENDEKQALTSNLGSPHCTDLADNYFTITNWDDINASSCCKIEYEGNVSGISYTTAVEKTWFEVNQEEPLLEDVLISNEKGTNCAW